MERPKFSPEQKERQPFFTVYCATEGKTIYQSSGINRQVENIIAREAAYSHANQLRHKVYIFENGKLN